MLGFLEGDCDGRNPATDLSRCYLHYIGRWYWTVLGKHGFLRGRMATDATCLLANHYQFFREVGLALEKDGIFVLLSDERSPTFWCDGPHGPSGADDGPLGFGARIAPQPGGQDHGAASGRRDQDNGTLSLDRRV